MLVLPVSRDNSYPVELFGACGISGVFTENKGHVQGRRGDTISVGLKLIYVWRADGFNSPKKVIVKMHPGKRIHPNSKAMALHLPIDVLHNKLHECEKTGKDPEGLFFDSAKFVSFEPETIELHDRQIREITMKVAVPLDLPDSIGIGKRKRSLTVMPVPKVIFLPNISSGCSGINIHILD
jgi:hypothetical protein